MDRRVKPGGDEGEGGLFLMSASIARMERSDIRVKLLIPLVASLFGLCA
jgi:hypothetical protein